MLELPLNFHETPMHNALVIFQVVLSVLLSLLILVQNKDGGLSAAVGGGEQSFRSTRRGPERVIFLSTVVVAILFVANALAIAMV